MKSYHKDRGWMYKCQGGPLGGQFIRGYNVLRGEEQPLDWDFRVQTEPGHVDESGRYVLKPMFNADGVTRKQAKHKGVAHDAFYYEWITE